MLKSLNVRFRHGNQAIPDLRVAVPEGFRGFPVIDAAACPGGCRACAAACRTGAVTPNPLSIDLGRCILCADCARACPNGSIQFSNFCRTAASDRGKLVVRAGDAPETHMKGAVRSSAAIRRTFGRSLKLRQVCAGGCAGCELELNACGNVNFDMGRFGIEFTASPRHADGVVVTGPVTVNMAEALEDTWRAVPDPKILIAVGACAISGGLFEQSPAVDRAFFAAHTADLFIPGCPPHPLTFINGILDLLGR